MSLLKTVVEMAANCTLVMPAKASAEIFVASVAERLVNTPTPKALMLVWSSAAKSTVVAVVPVAAAAAENVTLLIVDMVCL